ncbi:MAG: hypothetical protein ACLFTH_03465 [Candidatus Woesearchaeota archaeon]
MAEDSSGEKQPQHQMSNEEQIGFHKGSLSTLAKEREELARILGIVEQLMQMHIGSLKELGVDIEKDTQVQQAKQAGQSQQQQPEKKRPIEDIL